MIAGPKKFLHSGYLGLSWRLQTLIQLSFSIKQIPTQFEAIQRVLTFSAAEFPNKPVVILAEISFSGGLPLRLGAPGLQPKGLISVGISPFPGISIDKAPPYLGILPDASAGGRKRMQA